MSQRKVKWIWIDTFTKIPIDRKTAEYMHGMGYKVCLVSPELQGQPEKIEEYIKVLSRNKIELDAVCTKKANISIWNNGIECF